MLRPIVNHALIKSEIRRKVINYLFDISPNGSHISEIANNINTKPVNVIGALKGMNRKYVDRYSLIALNLVEQICVGKNKQKLYRLTDIGLELINPLKTKDRTIP